MNPKHVLQTLIDTHVHPLPKFYISSLRQAEASYHIPPLYLLLRLASYTCVDLCCMCGLVCLANSVLM